MTQQNHPSESPRHGIIQRGARAGLATWVALLLSAGLLREISLIVRAAVKPVPGVSYHNYQDPTGPWSIHVVKMERGNPEFEVHSALARGTRFGLATLSEQIRALPKDIGRPVAGLNGDFFRRREPYLGDPQGLQILRGELVSGPSDWTCLWLDSEGELHMTNVLSRFQVTWPTGEKTAFGLNEARGRNSAVLFTSVVGGHTQTSGGRELILERTGTNSWLPLRAGHTYLATVRQVRENGSSPTAPDTMILSLGRQLIPKVPVVKPGTVLQISTATWPELKDAPTAIGGGPAIVRERKVIERNDSRVRHPRAAVGWNQDTLFLVQVDGRRRGISVGMTMRELATYMAKIGCTEAMNLDGGGSATCWVYGQVMNTPSEGEERGMGNSIVIVQKEK